MRDIIGYGGGGGGSSHTHYEAVDSLHSTSYARVLDLVSEGEILGLANGVQSVYLNQTPVQNADGTSNFKNVTIDFRPGTQDQDYIAGFPDVENEISVGTELKSGTPWVHAISNTQLSAIRITLGLPALTKSDTTNGDILGYSIAYQIELSTDGGTYAVVLSNSFTGKTTSEYQRTARIDLPAATTGWQIRVTRLTANANTVGISDTTTIVSYTEVIDAKLRYPMSAIVGVQVDATQFQSVPTRAYDLFGRIIQVPSNYDPIARTYSGVWDGTFKPAWSNNPAWVFRDLILHDRYGLGDRITASQVDKWALYKIAQYCDEMVPDGKGGTEPRFTCNLYLQKQNQAYAVLQDIASIFRGISYWGAGSIMASADMPSDPVYVYTAANVIGGKFNRTGSKLSTRYTVALVTWNDPSDFYAQKVEYVEDQEGIARYGIQQVQLTAFGCTSQGQAQRAGRWALATSRLETEGISFDVGMDGAIALPGQVVRVADPSRMGKRVGGRVRTAAGRTVTLDKAPVVNVGDSLTVILPTGVSETHAVASVSGDSVTVDSDWTALPVAQSVWSVDSNELSAPLFRVLGVSEKKGEKEVGFTITAVQHEPGKYAFVENGVAITPRTQTSLDVTKQAAPASVSVSGYTISLNDVQKLCLEVSCAPVPGAVAYEGAYRRDNDNWIPLARQAGPTFDVVDVLVGSYVAKLSAVNSIGVTSTETVSDAADIRKDANPKNAGIRLDTDALAFHVASDGTVTPASITFTAVLSDIEGEITFSAQNGTLSNVTATTATLAYADVTASSAIVTASITVNGQTYSASSIIATIQDGADGAPGAPGAPGQDGATTYTWIKYATSATGAGLSDDPTGMTYIGFAYNKSTPDESIVATDYAWSLIKGSQGDQGVPGQPGADGVTHYTWIKYSDYADGTGLYDNPASSTQYIGIAVNKTTATESSIPSDYVWSKFKGDQGVPGTPGAPGGNGQRGPGNFYAAGNSWSDATAVSACPGGPVVSDQVTISNASTFTLTKRWDGSAWDVPGAYLSGDLFVDGTIQSSKVDTRGLSIKDASGNVILAAGSALPVAYAAPGTLNSDLTPAIDAAATKGAAINDDPGPQNPTAWSIGTNVTFMEDAGGVVGRNYWACSSGTDQYAVQRRRFPIDPAKTYNLSAMLYAEAGNDRNFYLYINFYDANGGQLHGTGGAQGTMSLYPWSGLPPTSAWTRLGGNFGAGTGITIPDGVASAEIGVWFQYSVEGSSQVLQAAQDIRIEDVTVAFNAQAAADAANNEIASITSDNMLDKGDKARVIADWAVIADEVNDVLSKADSLAVDRGAYYSAYIALGNYLPVGWNDVTVDTPIDGPTFRQKFTDYYTAKQSLINAMNAKAATIATYLAVPDTRNDNTPPSGYAVGHMKEFKDQSVIGIPGASSGNYCSVETVKSWNDSSGGNAIQWAYIDSGTVWKRSAGNGDSSWGAWVRDLDRNLYTGDLNATVGAPSGTNVGSTPAETVESNAAAGKSASDAIPGINSAIADKLSKTSASSLAATVTLTTGGSILSGDTTNGTYQSPSGFYGVQGGVVKFSAPISGDPTFGGQLTAAYGTFGAVSIASGGNLALQATSYNNDQGVWFGYVSGVPKFSIVASNGAKLLFDPTQANALQIINATVSGSNKPSVTLTNHASGTYANGTVTYGGVTLTITNGTAPFTVSWACADTGDINKLGIASSDNTGATIKSVGGSTSNSHGAATVSVTVVDANGIAATGSAYVSITCGTGA